MEDAQASSERTKPPDDTTRKVPGPRYDEPRKNIKSFRELDIDLDSVYINLSCNTLTNFVGLTPFSRLTQLILDNNPIRSFHGCRILRKLGWLSLRNTPISVNIHFKLMCLVAFGTSLISINSESVPDQLKHDALELRDALFPHLQDGKVISRLRPLSLLDMSHRGGHVVVCPSTGLIDAAAKVAGYLGPSERRMLQTLKEPKFTPPRPSTAAILQDFISKRPRFFGADGLPAKFVAQFVQRAASLREEFTEADVYYSGYEEEEEEKGEPLATDSAETDQQE
jgi:hypothetical protein